MRSSTHVCSRGGHPPRFCTNQVVAALPAAWIYPHLCRKQCARCDKLPYPSVCLLLLVHFSAVQAPDLGTALSVGGGGGDCAFFMKGWDVRKKGAEADACRRACALLVSLGYLNGNGAKGEGGGRPTLTAPHCSPLPAVHRWRNR